ncbi:type II toxin-antitoxin system VapC family toxin [Mucilaginibacter angelicae]|uniref:Ribonuclease VapC n=1 Tax=Mucilaginibacter angelicae TaxID=869718 RepID=A0ABV6LC42_9SPHI
MAAEQIICDTDVMIEYLDGRRSRHQSTKLILEDVIGLENVVLSAVTKIELMAGATNKAELKQVNKNIYWFNILLFNPEITSIAIRLMESYKLSHNLAMPDALIASTAIYTNHKLFTYNLKDYKFIEDIKLFDSEK